MSEQIYSLDAYEVKLQKPTRDAGEDEYIAPNNIIFCKTCKTPRQCVISVFGELKVRPVMCKCREEEHALAAQKKQEEERRQQIEYNRLSGIRKEKYRQYTFANDDGKTPKMLEQCKKYVLRFEDFKKTGQGLIFAGSVGTGKTYYAIAIANALIDKGYKVKVTSMSEIVSDFQDWENAEYNFQSLLKNHCIVIDDLGTERDTSFANEKIYRFFNEVNISDIPLVVTTNQSIEEFENAIHSKKLTDARIFSRVLEKCYPVAVESVKRRAEKSKKNREAFKETLRNTDLGNDHYSGQEPYWCK